MSYNINSVFLSEAQQGRLNDMRISLQRGANVNAADREGNTALHSVAEYDRIECMQWLIEQGADIDASNNLGWSALHTAAFHESFNAVKCLVSNGANYFMQNHKGKTPFDITKSIGNDTNDSKAILHYLEAVMQNKIMDNLIVLDVKQDLIQF